MKKILLGVAILSAMAYAEGTTQTPLGEDGQIQIVEIKTTARIIASGLIITDGTANSSTQKNNFDLAHGDITTTGTEDKSEVSSNFSIKRGTNGEQLGKKGYQLTLSMNHDGKLKKGDDEIEHSLKINLGSSNDFLSPGNLANTRPLLNEDTVINGTITSKLLGEYKQAPVGEYSNTATLTVTISKPATGRTL